MPVTCLSVDLHKARDHDLQVLVPSFCSLRIVGILGRLSLPRLGVLHKSAFLTMKLAKYAYRRFLLDHASTLSLPLSEHTTVNEAPKLQGFMCDSRKHRRDGPSASADSVKPCLCIVDTFSRDVVMKAGEARRCLR
jgi:hypothetical protein